MGISLGIADIFRDSRHVEGLLGLVVWGPGFGVLGFWGWSLRCGV